MHKRQWFKITKTPVTRVAETQAEESCRGCQKSDGTFHSKSRYQGSGSALFLQTNTQSLCLWTWLRQRVKNWQAWRNLLPVWGCPRSWGKTIWRRFSEQYKMYYLYTSILKEKTIPETPQQNGLADMCNKALLEMVRCLLIDSRLPKMWGASILHATRIRNLIVTREEKCPAELIRGIKAFN